MPATRTFRFRPRYGGLAWTAIGVGTSLSAATLVASGLLLGPILAGAAGLGLGAAYLASPAWKMVVTVDDTGLEVRTVKGRKLYLAWPDVVKVTASPATASCFVDGGAPERSLLVPGDGAPAPYTIEDKAALVELIVTHVTRLDPAKVTTVESLDRA